MNMDSMDHCLKPFVCALRSFHETHPPETEAEHPHLSFYLQLSKCIYFKSLELQVPSSHIAIYYDGLPRLKLHLCWHAPSSTHYLQYPNTSTRKKYLTWASEVKLKMRELRACQHYEQQEPICCNERGQLNFPNSTQPSWLSSHFNINPKISTQHNHDISVISWHVSLKNTTSTNRFLMISHVFSDCKVAFGNLSKVTH